jgi:hypothetical protein
MCSDWLLHGTEIEPANVPSGSMAAGDQETVLGQLRSWSAARRIIQKQTIAW